MQTIPKAFVESNEMYSYTGAKLLFGRLVFEVDLVVKVDTRRPADRTHVVMKSDWSSFLKTTGLVVGDAIRMELKKDKSILGGVAVLSIC
jgi:hypothetical protein